MNQGACWKTANDSGWLCSRSLYVARIPKNASPSAPIGEVRFVPPLEYRATDYPSSRDADWAVRNKLNGTQTRIDARRGGKVDYSHFVHTFNDILTRVQNLPDVAKDVVRKVLDVRYR